MEKTVFYKIRRLFRLTFVLTLSLYCLAAKAQVARLSLNMQQVPLQQVMDEIKNQTRYLFVNQNVENVNRKVSIQVVNKTIPEVLDQLFTPFNIGYKIDRTNIYIFEKKKVEDKPIAITGKVFDTNNLPIVGASVIIKGTSTGVSTNADGIFALQIPAPAAIAQLEISYLGYVPVIITVGNQTFFNVVLTEAASEIESVVVTALGIKREEKALSYNVQQIEASDITTVKDANFMNSLTGKVAGVTINASSSGVGGASKVVLRGNKSISQSSNALYVIDGIPMYNFGGGGGTEFDSKGATEAIADINPEDIESISVLSKYPF